MSVACKPTTPDRTEPCPRYDTPWLTRWDMSRTFQWDSCFADIYSWEEKPLVSTVWEEAYLLPGICEEKPREV